MRIAIGQIAQETNTFNPLPTTRDDFEAFGIHRGDDLVREMQATNELGGFIQSLRRWPEEPQIVGLLHLRAWSGGRATAETFDWLRDELLGALQRALPVDGVLLALHGSFSAEQHSDVEGEILAAVRAVVGPHVPVIATLDLHANVTCAMAAAANALVLFHTAPHVDVFETGERGAAVLQRILTGGARPVTALVRVQGVFPVERANTEASSGISADLKRRLKRIEARPEVLTAGLATVQPWLDIPNLGSAVVVTTDDDASLASELASEVATELWRRREEYMPELHSVEDAVALAHANPKGLVVLSDAADATTSGSPGDSVWVLEELLKRDWPRPVLVTVVAPQIVRVAQQGGIGQRWSGPIGGVRDNRFGKPIQLSAEIENLFDARFVMSGHLGKNLAIDMGRSAVLRAGQVRVIVTERSGPHFAPELFRAAGFDPFEAAVVVAKSPAGFRAVYAARAAAIYCVRAPGCAPPDFWKYDYGQISRPLWPWDEIPHWKPEAQVFKASDSGAPSPQATKKRE